MQKQCLQKQHLHTYKLSKEQHFCLTCTLQMISGAHKWGFLKKSIGLSSQISQLSLLSSTQQDGDCDQKWSVITVDVVYVYCVQLGFLNKMNKGGFKVPKIQTQLYSIEVTHWLLPGAGSSLKGDSVLIKRINWQHRLESFYSECSDPYIQIFSENVCMCTLHSISVFLKESGTHNYNKLSTWPTLILNSLFMVSTATLFLHFTYSILQAKIWELH